MYHINTPINSFVLWAFALFVSYLLFSGHRSVINGAGGTRITLYNMKQFHFYVLLYVLRVIQLFDRYLLKEFSHVKETNNLFHYVNKPVIGNKHTNGTKYKRSTSVNEVQGNVNSNKWCNTVHAYTKRAIQPSSLIILKLFILTLTIKNKQKLISLLLWLSSLLLLFFFDNYYHYWHYNCRYYYYNLFIHLTIRNYH